MCAPLRAILAAVLLALGVNATLAADPGPFDGKTFKGRIAWSADGNHNDQDDWAASPVALAIFAQAGARERLVHFDYNSILPQTDPEWEKIHAASVLGAAERYGYERSVFHDCRKDSEAAANSIARAIDASSAEDPLYFIIAGPVGVPLKGILKSDPVKRKHVYCISHSAWNDGFARRYTFTHTKRSVIPSGVRWVQIEDQNRLLSKTPYGRPAEAGEFQPYFWMRDSADARVRFLWERMLVSTRPDPSDAGMAYFLVTGDEQADPEKLRLLLDRHEAVKPVPFRRRVRIEAENFEVLDGCEVEYVDDRSASHRISVRLTGSGSARIRTAFDQPYTATAARYDVDVRYFDDAGRSELKLTLSGAQQGDSWTASADDRAWHSHTLTGVRLRRGDQIAVEIRRDGGEVLKLDYLDLRLAGEGGAYFPPPETQGGWRSLVAANQEPSPEQKARVREVAGLDWDRLADANAYVRTLTQTNSLLVIRRGWVAGEWHTFTNPRGIASCTKSLTALAMAKLFDLSDAGRLPANFGGRIGIDDEAWRYLPAAWAEAEPDRKKILLRHLLTMTSGLTPYDGPYQADYEQKLFAQTVEAPPGTVWGYASVPVDMLSLVIENVTGGTEAEFFQREIHTRLGGAQITWGTFGAHTGAREGPWAAPASRRGSWRGWGISS